MNKIHFPGKEPGEIIEMALRRHGVAIAKKISGLLIGVILLAVVYILLRNFTEWLDDDEGLFFILFILGGSLFVLFIILFIFHAWVDYYLDIWLITNQRIVATEQKGLFNRVVSELRLDRIQDVSSEVKGFFPTLFKYGSIHVQTASEQDKFWFDDVPQPELASRKILELHERYISIDRIQPRLQHDQHQHMTSDQDYHPPR
ncbi:PH domain-containing protein [Patescibacteria group bacterium]|nr:PH domain-containing protein [Patescibacteria group bacterium]